MGWDGGWGMGGGGRERENEYLTCQSSSSCDSSSLRWMASNNRLLSDIMSFLLFNNSTSIRFFLPRKNETFLWTRMHSNSELRLQEQAFYNKTMNRVCFVLQTVFRVLSKSDYLENQNHQSLRTKDAVIY